MSWQVKFSQFGMLERRSVGESLDTSFAKKFHRKWPSSEDAFLI